jgi:hypothetical protein
MPADDELLVELDRVTDRLRVMVPRLIARATPQADRVLADLRAALQVLADLAADGEGRSRRPVPELAPHALADQLTVLGRDVATGCPEPALEQARDLLVDLRRRL